jgi:hypothetical protein
VYSVPTGRPSTAQANGLGPTTSSPRPCGFQALKGRHKDHRTSLGDHPRPSQNAISPFQGLRPNGKGSRTQSAWAVLVRPFGAHFQICATTTLGVQQEMWDTPPRRRGSHHCDERAKSNLNRAARLRPPHPARAGWRKRHLRSTLSPKGARVVNSTYRPDRPGSPRLAKGTRCLMPTAHC